jgi:hypothetical protein
MLLYYWVNFLLLSVYGILGYSQERTLRVRWEPPMYGLLYNIESILCFCDNVVSSRYITCLGKVCWSDLEYKASFLIACVLSVLYQLDGYELAETINYSS